MAQDSLGDLGLHDLLLAFQWALPLPELELERAIERGKSNGLIQRAIECGGEDWSTAERFLMPNSDPAERWSLLATGTSIDRHPIALKIAADDSVPCEVTVGRHKRFGVLTVTLACAVTPTGTLVSSAAVDRAIAVLQSLQKLECGLRADPSIFGVYRGEHDGTMGWAVFQAVKELLPDLQEWDWPNRYGWCVEFRGPADLSPAEVLKGHALSLYGLATSDEGWRHVPDSVARQRLGKPWSTRTFFAAYPLGPGIVCINNKGDDYVVRQDEWTRTHHGRIEPYFSMKPGVAGLDHGALLVLERVLTRQVLADRWLKNAQQELTSSRKLGENNRRSLLRASLDDVLEMLEARVLSEVDPLERTLVHNLGLEVVISQLDRQAQAIDEKIRYDYETLVSRRVARLTWVTVILTVVTIIIGVLQVLVPLFTRMP